MSRKLERSRDVVLNLLYLELAPYLQLLKTRKSRKSYQKLDESSDVIFDLVGWEFARISLQRLSIGCHQELLKVPRDVASPGYKTRGRSWGKLNSGISVLAAGKGRKSIFCLGHISHVIRTLAHIWLTKGSHFRGFNKGFHLRER